MQVDELAIARRGKPRWAYSGDVEWTAKAVWWVRAVAVGVLVILLAGPCQLDLRVRRSYGQRKIPRLGCANS